MSTALGTTAVGSPGRVLRTAASSMADVAMQPSARSHVRSSSRRTFDASTRPKSRRTDEVSNRAIRARSWYSMLCSSTTTGVSPENRKHIIWLDSTWTMSKSPSPRRASSSRCIASEWRALRWNEERPASDAI